MWSVCAEPREREREGNHVRRFGVCTSHFLSKTWIPISTAFCSSYLNLCHKTETFFSFSFSPSAFSYSFFLLLLLLSLSPFSSLVDGLCCCLSVVSQRGNSACTLGKHTFCNHYQYISHSLWVSFCLIAALDLVMFTSASYSWTDLWFTCDAETKSFNCTWHCELML